MKDVFLTNYKVSGIKSIERPITLSFYKKTIKKPIDTTEYNIKGIYGINGAGKSAIVSSIGILKNIILNANYLRDSFVQKKLEALICKKTQILDIEAEFMTELESTVLLYQYSISIGKSVVGLYEIKNEKLYVKKATSQAEQMNVVFVTENGVFADWKRGTKDNFAEEFYNKTMNLLSASSMCSLFVEKILLGTGIQEAHLGGIESLFHSLVRIFLFGSSLYAYIGQEDEHTGYLMSNYLPQVGSASPELGLTIQNMVTNHRIPRGMISVSNNQVEMGRYADFEQDVNNLKGFIRIFKKELIDIEIEKKQNKDRWQCDLIMVYESFKVNAEFESTGIKKLIQLYAYFREMMNGGIVFIDELDSNLHDVYLCALLEYLMRYGKGQLCFTTHNVGPMDILKQNKKSIDFITEDRDINSWTTNGNYSPSKLYRSGMIEGSPFNIDSIDFIGVFEEE